ncbi:unnamed protein product, partial [Clonostachys chloroleuca]
STQLDSLSKDTTAYQYVFPWEGTVFPAHEKQFHVLTVVKAMKPLVMKNTAPQSKTRHNALLNELNLKVGEGIYTPLSVTMYLQYLTMRINPTTPSHLELTHLPNRRSPSLGDNNLSEAPPKSHLGFWFFGRESRDRLYPERDIRCGNWQEFDVGQDITTEGAREHICGFNDKLTDFYRSLTTSPLCIWSLADKRGIKPQKVLVIDLHLGFCGTGVI